MNIRAQKSLYFQSDNRVYNKKLTLDKGRHTLSIGIEDIPINNGLGRVSISIWSEGHEVALFWCRWTIDFDGIPFSTGRNFLKANFCLD